MLFRSVPPFSFGTCISRSYGSSYTGTYRFDTMLTLLGGVYFERDLHSAQLFEKYPSQSFNTRTLNISRVLCLY